MTISRELTTNCVIYKLSFTTEICIVNPEVHKVAVMVFFFIEVLFSRHFLYRSTTHAAQPRVVDLIDWYFCTENNVTTNIDGKNEHGGNFCAFQSNN